jgi:uncharacterized protein YecE (DUF72 family)
VSLHVGPAGWSYADWAGIVYPRPRPRGFSELAHLARYFDLIEINTTFYRPIDGSMARSWLRKVGMGFQFTAKLWQKFTHEPGPFDANDVALYRSGVEPLARAGALSAVLAQFPWSFTDTETNRERIRQIRAAFTDWTVAVELRHSSWNSAEGLEFLRGLGLAFCNIDQPRTKSAISETAIVTAPTAYVRLHGRNREAWFDSKAAVWERYNYLYSPEELRSWVDRIREMEKKAGRVFVVANNHYQGKAVANALQLKSMFTGRPVEAPEGLIGLYPSLQGYVARKRQPELF